MCCQYTRPNFSCKYCYCKQTFVHWLYFAFTRDWLIGNSYWDYIIKCKIFRGKNTRDIWELVRDKKSLWRKNALVNLMKNFSHVDKSWLTVCKCTFSKSWITVPSVSLYMVCTLAWCIVSKSSAVALHCLPCCFKKSCKYFTKYKCTLIMNIWDIKSS